MVLPMKRFSELNAQIRQAGRQPPPVVRRPANQAMAFLDPASIK
jgi:hypothetical protein